jgi:hypothetical protein
VLCCLVLIVFNPVLAQEERGTYIFMDLFVAREGSVLLYGETNLEDGTLSLGAATFPLSGGSFSNTTDELTSKVGSRWNLSLVIEEQFAYGEINVYLPAGTVLVDPPAGVEVSEEKGSLLVAFYGVQPGEEIRVTYELGPASFSLDVEDYLLPIAVVAVVLIAIGLRFLWPRFRGRGQGEERRGIDRAKWDAISPTLTEREQMVLDAVVKEGGRISQRKLRHVCDLPKSSLSRVTDELQRKGLLRKIPVGQTNEIRLAEHLLGE